MRTVLIFAFIYSHNLFAQDQFNELQIIKKNCRQEVVEHSFIPNNNQNKSIILRNDRAEDLVEDPGKMIFTLAEMDNQKLMAKNVTVAPWSDTYWPLFEGTLGQRYNDNQGHFGNWKEAHDYVLANPAKDLIRQKKFDSLSPSEKYDLLLSLGTENLTKASWAEGEEYFKEYGQVETWMGLCHGWSAASMMMPNPAKKVNVQTSAGKITFYPSDIKALGTLLWAKGSFNTRFIGGRCNAKNPATDGLGRPIQPDCLDNNPGTWHLSIVNQIGVFDRSFVMDATYDYQVWNQPVYGYEYTYYNPKTQTDSKTLEEATVKLSEWPEDERKSVRAPNAKSLVGIKMLVTYVSENSPSTEEFQESRLTNVNYQYDLELDANNKIIGGEWHSDNHPDFLWVADKNAFPATYGDGPNINVNLNNISRDVKNAGAVNARNELPFGAVVRELFKASAE